MRFALEKAGYRVTEAPDGTRAYELVEREPFDLVVLDIVMPEDDGLTLCRKIRARSRLPIIFVSSRDEELDRVLGLELGADDYLTKPFSPRELAARVAAVLRRTLPGPAPDAAAPPLVRGPIQLDVVRHTCQVSGRELSLTVTEFELLRALLQSPGRVLSRAQLVELAYGAGHYISDRTVDSHVRRLRAKLGDAAGTLETVYGVGYRLSE
jgi:two-component system OmpR family response regulator